MKSNDETAAKKAEPGNEHKRTRFRMVKLEERIAPSKGGHFTGDTKSNRCYA